MNKLKIGDKVTIIPSSGLFGQLKSWKNKTAIVTKLSPDNWAVIKSENDYVNSYPTEDLNLIKRPLNKEELAEITEIKTLLRKTKPNSLERHIIIRCSQMYTIEKTKFN